MNRVTGLSVVANHVQLNPLTFAPGLLPAPVGTGGAGIPEEVHG
jgi:hypothetical protein